jgi:acyl-CoA synthetase (AMP-forming)/AMP-acid ligase II
VLALLDRYRNVSLFAAPTMLKRLTLASEASDANTRNLRTVVYGGGPMYVADLQHSCACSGRSWCRSMGRARRR